MSGKRGIAGSSTSTSPDFPLYRQRRVGRYGLPVEIYKLRTMVPDADRVERHLTPEQVEQWKAEHKVDDDPRVTRIGRWLLENLFDGIAGSVFDIRFTQACAVRAESELRIIEVQMGSSLVEEGNERFGNF